jgi:hypothetical protein
VTKKLKEFKAMSYDEREARKSRVVVETPNSRREIEQSEAIRVPERSGVSSTTVGILVVLVVALVTILVLLLMNNQSNDMANANFAAGQPSPIPQTTIIEQPSQQQPPIIIQQPAAPASQPAPIIVTPPPSSSAPASGTDDATIQAAIDKKIADDPNLSGLAVVTTVLNGKATITGTVKSESLKGHIENLVRGARGIKEVDNQLIVMS